MPTPLLGKTRGGNELERFTVCERAGLAPPVKTD